MRAYEIFTLISSDTELRQKLAVINYQGILSSDRAEALSKPESTLRDWYYGEFQTRSFFSYMPEIQFDLPPVCVDLGAPDEMIVTAFREWLVATRKAQAEFDPDYCADIAPKKFSERQIEKWHKAAILPYLDLKIYERISGKRIPLHAIGAAIFPNTVDVDTTESVRKTTKPRAEAALRQHGYLLRQAIIEELHNKPE